VLAGRDDMVLRLTSGVFVEGELLGEGWVDEAELSVTLVKPGAKDIRFAERVAHQALGRGERRFRVGPVAPGLHDLAVMASSHHEALALERDVRAPSSALRLTLPPARHVVGRIVNDDAQGFRVRAIFDSTTLDTGLDASGRIRILSARPGRVTLVAGKDGDERYGLVEDVDPTAGPVELRFQKGLVIAGRVEGLPAGEKASLEVRADGRLGSQSLETVGDGRFRLGGLPPGAYDVRVEIRVGKEYRMLFAHGVVAGGPDVVLAFAPR
jgi:hypothetical protein